MNNANIDRKENFFKTVQEKLKSHLSNINFPKMGKIGKLGKKEGGNGRMEVRGKK